MLTYLGFLVGEMLVDCKASTDACFSNSESGAIVTFWYYVAIAGLVLVYLHWDSLRVEKRRKNGNQLEKAK